MFSDGEVWQATLVVDCFGGSRCFVSFDRDCDGLLELEIMPCRLSPTTVYQ